MNKILHLIYNPQSGQGLASKLPDLAQDVAMKLGWTVQLYKMNLDEDMDHLVSRVLKRQQEEGGRLAAAGGDGTLRSVIQKIANTSTEFAAIPSGTFNIFARTHQIPLDHHEALELAMSGQPEKVRLGSFNDQIFLINANIGLYAKAIRERRPWVKMLGRNRLVASMATLWTFFKEYKPLKLSLKSDSIQKDVKASLLFIGNSPLQLEAINLEYGASQNLAFLFVKDLTFYDRLRLLWKGLWGSLKEENKLELLSLPDLEIGSQKKMHKVVLDGETVKLPAPFQIKSLPKGLLLIKSLR